MVLSGLLKGSRGLTSLASLAKYWFVVQRLRLNLNSCPVIASPFQAVSH